jgi:hypothetical protein
VTDQLDTGVAERRGIRGVANHSIDRNERREVDLSGLFLHDHFALRRRWGA